MGLRHGPAPCACVMGLRRGIGAPVGDRRGGECDKVSPQHEVACRGTVPEAGRPGVALTWQHSFFFGHKGLAHQGEAFGGRALLRCRGNTNIYRCNTP